MRSVLSLYNKHFPIIEGGGAVMVNPSSVKHYAPSDASSRFHSSPLPRAIKAAFLTAALICLLSQPVFAQSGPIIVGDDTVGCTGANAGGMRYVTASNILEYCNGTSWTALGGASTPTAETITAGATITANACGSIKRVTSASNVTTNTTNTFTASTAAGCCMDVINTGSNTVTLDANAKFKTSADIDQPLGPSGTTRVCSDGTNWYQIYTPDTEPAPVDFTDATGAPANTVTESDIILISGINAPVQVTISGAGSPQFQICSTSNCSSVVVAWTSSANTISNGQYLQVRQTSAGTPLTATSLTVNVGTGIITWNLTTDDWKIVFAETSNNGNMGGFSGAAGRCQTAATNAGLPGTYKAWISESSTLSPVNQFTQSSLAYRLVDGTKVADNWSDLTDGTLDAGINKTETGASAGAGGAWTNTNTSGTVFSTTNHCSNWTVGTCSDSVRAGTTGATNSTWTNNFSTTCCQLYNLYCFQQ